MDLTPHVDDAAPPRFRPAGDHQWAALSAREAAAWAADIPNTGDFIDQTPSDPWERE